MKPMGNAASVPIAQGQLGMKFGPMVAFPVSMASSSLLLWLRKKRTSHRMGEQWGRAGWTYWRTRLQSLLSTSARDTTSLWRRNCQKLVESRGRHGRVPNKTKTLVIVKQKERTENQGKPPGSRRSDVGDLSGRVLTQGHPCV